MFQPLFDEYTSDYIMQDMLNSVPDDVDHTEGSLTWNALAKIAMELEEAYINLGDVYDNILCDTQDMEHLIESGAECGVPVKEETAGTFEVLCNCELEEGAQVDAVEADYSYIVLDSLGTEPYNDSTYYAYEVECDELGSAPNAYLGEVEPEDPPDDFEYAIITAIIAGGRDLEDEDEYRLRRLRAFDIKPFAGNRAYYKEVVEAISGVETCYIDRVKQEGAVLNLVIVGEGYTVPSDELIKTVQATVDPVQGEGEGAAPIGAKVTVKGVTSTTVNVSCTLTLASGYTVDGIKSQLETAIDDYCKELAEKMVKSASSGIFRRAVIEAKFIEVEGVDDVKDITLNGASDNLDIPVGTIPVRGTLTC